MIRIKKLYTRAKKREKENEQDSLRTNAKTSNPQKHVRKVLHRTIYAHLQQGWQVEKLDKQGLLLVKPSGWRQRLLFGGFFGLPLLGLGLLFWILALFDFWSGESQQKFIPIQHFQQGKPTRRGKLTPLQRIFLFIFITLFCVWLILALPFFMPNTFYTIVQIPVEVAFLSAQNPSFQFQAIVPLAGIPPIPTDAPPLQGVTPTPTATQAAETALPTLTPLMPMAQTATATQTHTPTATATPRPDPLLWMDWPVIPKFSQNWLDIYQLGISQGNNPQAFSVVGDCQSVPYLFMGLYDGGFYSANSISDSQKETIEFFSGSFSRYSMTIIDGANAASELARGWANRNWCDIDESPLNCELRLHKPSFVIINIGTHWTGRNGEYLRTIVETIIESGAVPLLATKGDNLEGDHSINLEIAQIASDYDIPLWNLWRAVQDLPGHGLDPYRQGGNMYFTSAGLQARRESALRVLDTLRQAVD